MLFIFHQQNTNRTCAEASGEKPGVGAYDLVIEASPLRLSIVQAVYVRGLMCLTWQWFGGIFASGCFG